MSERITISDVIRAASLASGLGADELRSPGRNARLATWRQAAMAVARKRARLVTGDPVSYPLIGKAFGRRDHTTVMHAVRKAERPDADWQRYCMSSIEARLFPEGVADD